MIFQNKHMEHLKITPWFERKFPAVSNSIFPVVLERLVGTSSRLREKVNNLADPVLSRRSNDDWSVKEHIGHLADLEPLWIGRIADIRLDQHYLREADLSNQKTFLAGHNDRPIEDIMADFTNLRKRMINDLLSLQLEDLEKSALHPRLKTPMHIVDLMHFVAEHDDHHLAFCTHLIRSAT